MNDDRRAQFIVRGDLRSHTGYGQHTRAFINLINQQNHVIYGADISPDPEDNREQFPYPLIEDEAIPDLVMNSDRKSIIFHFTIPDSMVRIAPALNIGCFHWETTTIPMGRNWPAALQLMDEVWAPSEFVAHLVRQMNFRGPIHIVRWPQDDLNGQQQIRVKGARKTEVELVYMREGKALSQSTSVGDLRGKARNLFLAVQTMTPRKGLPILLREWRLYGSSDDVLLIKLSYRHALGLGGDPISDVGDVMRLAGFDDGGPMVGLVLQYLSNADMIGLHKLADAYVTASYGEGFGGPIADSLRCGRPVIGGRHSGIGDLLPPGYALSPEVDEIQIMLKGNSTIYPRICNWWVSREGEIARCLTQFSAMEDSERERIARDGQQYMEANCATPHVKRVVDQLLSGR